MIYRWLLLLLVTVVLDASEDLEVAPDLFVLETKQIHLTEYPDAFNPSIVRWNGRLLMSFRNIANPKDSYNSSEIGIVYLDQNFQPVNKPQIFQLGATRRAEDARLIDVDGHLFMVYSDNEDLNISKGGFRVYVAELEEENGIFKILSNSRFTDYENENPALREKNWTPFDYQSILLLSYSLTPHLVFRPLLGTEKCETFSNSQSSASWKWGDLRGGTQSLRVGDRYLTFFHSSVRMNSAHSDVRVMLHYFMGACTFDGEPPFAMTHISPKPIIGKGFFSGPVYPPYWGSWRGIFPGGLIDDNDYIWIVYGRQNHELWMVKLDKKGLLDSLVAVPE